MRTVLLRNANIVFSLSLILVRRMQLEKWCGMDPSWNGQWMPCSTSNIIIQSLSDRSNRLLRGNLNRLVSWSWNVRPSKTRVQNSINIDILSQNPNVGGSIFNLHTSKVQLIVGASIHIRISRLSKAHIRKAAYEHSPLHRYGICRYRYARLECSL